MYTFLHSLKIHVYFDFLIPTSSANTIYLAVSFRHSTHLSDCAGCSAYKNFYLQAKSGFLSLNQKFQILFAVTKVVESWTLQDNKTARKVVMSGQFRNRHKQYWKLWFCVRRQWESGGCYLSQRTCFKKYSDTSFVLNTGHLVAAIPRK